jgi:hypothetical protein
MRSSVRGSGFVIVALLASAAACTPRARHDREAPPETGTTTSQMPAWTRVLDFPPPRPELLRPTPEERSWKPQPPRGPDPAWVPETGRLTIVEAPDLAKNLGVSSE